MRKLNGITIDGEYLGNSVVINGMFRAICTISPIIMRNFVRILDKIDSLDEAVKIYNFHCGYDSIDVQFENHNLKGVASLYFKLQDDELVLIDSKLEVNDVVIDGGSSLSTKHTIVDNAQNPILSSETERQRKIREIKERKIAELRKRREDKLLLSNNNNSQVVSETDNRNLTKAELRQQKINEIRERKRRELLAKRMANMPNQEFAQEVISEENLSDDNENIEEQKFLDNDSSLNVSETLEKHDSENDKNSLDIHDSNDSASVSESKNDITSEKTDSNNGSQPDIDIENVNMDEDVSEENDGMLDNPDDYNINDEGINYSENSDSQFDDDTADDYTADDVTPEASNTEVIKENLSYDEYGDLTKDEIAQIEAEIQSEFGDDFTIADNFNNFSDSSPANGGFGSSDDEFFSAAMQSSDGKGYTIIAKSIRLEVVGADNIPESLSNQSISNSFDNSNNVVNDFSNLNFGNDMSQSPQPSNMPVNQPINNAPMQQPYPTYPQYSQPQGMQNADTAQTEQPQHPYPQYPYYPPPYPPYPPPYPYPQDAQGQQEGQMPQNMQSYPPPYPYMYPPYPYPYPPMAPQDFGMPSGQSFGDGVQNAESNIEQQLAVQQPRMEELMTLDQFKAKQEQIKAVAEKKLRKKFRIVGSKERINASALDGGVYVAGNKVYKWGETRQLDE